MGHWRNQIGNKNIPGDKQKWKHMIWNLWDATKTILRKKFSSNISLPQETRKILRGSFY